jgi:galactose mutarotase-like enzyme
MVLIEDDLSVDQVPVVRLQNEALQVDVAPAVGGRILSIQHRATGYQFLWRNPHLDLRALPAGSEYDPNFYGGIDELLPNDIPELLNGVASPDHGELWTLPLDHAIERQALVLRGALPLCGLAYEKRLALRSREPYIDLDYCIENRAQEPRVFLWKLHAAMNIEAGDRIECPAKTARVVDRSWSRWETLHPFPWPTVGDQRADIIPAQDGSMDFLFLYDLQSGEMGWRSLSRGLQFTYHFDRQVFPYAWYFASYGGFDGHYVAILEPCSAMPLSVNEAARLGQCSRLEPGQRLETRVTVYAGYAR